jgi:hypothetical protein
MARFVSGAFIALVVLGFSPDVHAVPSFTWTEPWNVTLLSNCLPFNPTLCGSHPRAFGASATQDGQILNTTADIAVAKSSWAAGNSPGTGSTGVMFSRQFVLSGAPEGWTVSLDGILNGALTAFGSNTARVTAEASITPALGITSDVNRRPFTDRQTILL